MTQPELILYIFPGACSRVTLTALEYVGAKYSTRMVNLMKGEHKSPQYQATNPRGKVPALLVNGKLLSENGAILSWLNDTYPEAGLLPKTSDTWHKAQQVSDLFWLSSVWHPYTRANKMPIRWTMGDIEPVRERGKELIEPCIAQLDERLGQGAWWLGDDWSILDVYFYWNYTTAEEGEFDLSPYANIARHRAAIEALPAFQRAIAKEIETKTAHEAA